MKTCCICGKQFEGFGNNPFPVRTEGICCDDCNLNHVIPSRLNNVFTTEEKTGTISISTEDADGMLEYFRNEMREENKKYEEYCKMLSNDKTPDFLRDIGKIIGEKGHAHNIKLLTDFIEILTCGAGK